MVSASVTEVAVETCTFAFGRPKKTKMMIRKAGTARTTSIYVAAAQRNARKRDSRPSASSVPVTRLKATTSAATRNVTKRPPPSQTQVGGSRKTAHPRDTAGPLRVGVGVEPVQTGAHRH